MQWEREQNKRKCQGRSFQKNLHKIQHIKAVKRWIITAGRDCRTFRCLLFGRATGHRTAEVARIIA